jgi:uncharacterized protein (DUF2235 family)
VAKNIVLCLDGTNNKVRSASNTNVVRLYHLLDLEDPTKQVGYYSPGVGTFSSPAAWSAPARALSRWAGLGFGVGLRQNLGAAYTYLMSVYEPDDKIFVLGFSRGAYTARALTGMLEVFGIMRHGAENLVPFAVAEFTRETGEGERDWRVLREYARIFGGRLDVDRRDHAPVHFVGLWDTVKAAGTLRGQLRWPFTRQLPHAYTVRHAVALDEWRSKYVEYLVTPPTPTHLIPVDQDLVEVWFAGVHSDVGGTYPDGVPISDIPLKWLVDEARASGLRVHKRRYNEICGIDPSVALGPPHRNAGWWRLLGTRRRKPPEGALVHASVGERIAADPAYRTKLPQTYSLVDEDWPTLRPFAPD